MARTIYMHGDFCALCGFRLVRSDHSEPTAANPLTWERKVRAVCFATTQARPFLTGVGFLRRRQVVADVDASVPYTDPAALLTTHRLGSDFGQGESDHLVFGFHDACWTLLLSRITPIASGQDPTRDETAAIAAHLYHVLFCLVGGRQKVLNPARDYGGAWRLRSRQSRTSYDGELPAEEWPFLLADPLQASIGNAPPQAWPTEQAFIRDANHPGDIFNRLPHELIMTVLSWLPSADLCNLRLASRVVSSVSSATSLPMSFWHSRFTSDFEMAFYMAGRLPEHPSKDWRVLYSRIRYCLARPSDYPAICNRRRIWHILGDLSITLKALLEGLPAKQAPISHTLLLPFRPGVAAIARQDPYENPACPPASFYFAWDAEEAFLNSNDISNLIKISTSFIHFDGRSFICGMRATASTPSVTLSQVGLIRPITEQYFYLERGQKITKVQVVSSLAGVVGVRYLIQTTGPGNAESVAWHSIGTTSKLQEGVGIAELNASRKILGLTVRFDACKCISIGLLEPDDGFENEPKIVPPLWFPDIPRDFQFSSQALGQDTCEEEPKYYLNMDFGGPQGERLSLLSRITPFLNGQGLLMGMAFFYDDGTELVFGFRWAFHSLLSATICPEPSIEIRGSAGERIIRVYCEADAKHQPPRPRFQIETNLAFKSTFGMHHRGCSFPKGSLTTGSQGHIITGLVAKMTGFHGYVEKLDARYIRGDVEVSSVEEPHSLVISREHLDVAAHVVQFNSEACTSGVELGQVRTIQFSTGDNNHCRSRRNICGMLIKFWDTDHPLILGQWITEIEGTCIELQRGEKLIEIAIWYTQVKSMLAPRYNNNRGRIAGIRLVSSKGQVRHIRLDDTSAMLFVQYRDNPFEEITGLVWTFNRQWELIQVLRRTSLAHTGTMLVPLGLQKLNNTQISHHDERDLHDIGKIFWREIDPEMNVECELTAMDAFFSHGSGDSSDEDDEDDEDEDYEDGSHNFYDPSRVVLVGLRFRYTHSVERQFGCCTTRRNIMMESVELGSDQVTCFERGRGDRDARVLMSLTFHFASGRTATLPAEAEAEIVTSRRELFVLGTEKDLLEERTALMNDTEGKVHGPPPRARRCVGLWVQTITWPVAEDQIRGVGPLFQCAE